MALAILSLRAFTVGPTDFQQQITPIDLKVSGATSIEGFDWGTDSKTVIFAARVDVIDAVSVTQPAIISIGTNSPDYNNIVKVLAVPGEANWSQVVELPNPVILGQIPAIFAKVVVAGIGTTFRAGIFVYHSEYKI